MTAGEATSVGGRRARVRWWDMGRAGAWTKQLGLRRKEDLQRKEFLCKEEREDLKEREDVEVEKEIKILRNIFIWYIKNILDIFRYSFIWIFCKDIVCWKERDIGKIGKL